MAVIIQVRRDLAANFTSADPVLAQGEIGFETDALQIKIGDGSTAWTALAYTLAAGGENNTGSNVGTDGEGVFDGKVALDLQFRNIAPGSTKISVVLNGKDIDLDVVEAFVDHDSLLNYVAAQHFTEASIDHDNILNNGVQTHAQIDTHVAAGDAHIATASIHFTEASIDHTAIQNIGTLTHAQLEDELDFIEANYMFNF